MGDRPNVAVQNEMGRFAREQDFELRLDVGVGIPVKKARARIVAELPAEVNDARAASSTEKASRPGWEESASRPETSIMSSPGVKSTMTSRDLPVPVSASDEKTKES